MGSHPRVHGAQGPRLLLCPWSAPPRASPQARQQEGVRSANVQQMLALNLSATLPCPGPAPPAQDLTAHLHHGQGLHRTLESLLVPDLPGTLSSQRHQAANRTGHGVTGRLSLELAPRLLVGSNGMCAPWRGLLLAYHHCGPVTGPGHSKNRAMLC